MKQFLPVLFFLTLVVSNSYAQQTSDFEDVEALGKKGFFKEYFKGFFTGFTEGDPFAASAGLGLNVRHYDAWGGDLRQPPLYWIMNANASINVYQVTIPFSALISLDRREVTKPNPQGLPNLPDVKERVNQNFNRIGFSPYYKWVKLHGGHRTMDFSDLTVSNLVYLGAGAELTPGNVRVGGFFGQLADAEPQDLSLTEPNIPVFKRKGWGTKLGYGDDDNFLDFYLFKAWDDPNSITFQEAQEVFPQENMVLSFKGQKRLFDIFVLSAEVAGSGLTANREDGDVEDKFPYFLLDSKLSTDYKKAVNTTVDYEGEAFTVGLKYRRIDAGYTSLGAYFFDNDIEDISARTSFSLLEQQLQLSGSLGLQRDNLDNTKPTTLTRVIGSANANYAKDNVSLGFNYSNYSSDVAFVLDAELDSLNAVIVTQDLGGNATYTIPSESFQHTISLSANVQDVSDDAVRDGGSNASKMFNVNMLYALQITDQNLGVNANWNYNTNELEMAATKRFGVGFGVTKGLLENKLNLGVNVNLFRTTITSLTDVTNKTTNVRFRANYNINEQHSLNLNYALMNSNKSGVNITATQFTELIGNIGYQYNFSWKPKGKKGGS